MVGVRIKQACLVCGGPFGKYSTRFCSKSCAIGFRNTAFAVRERATYPEPPAVRNARWVPLGKGLFALVSTVDFDRVNVFFWHLAGTPGKRYVYESKSGGELLHRFILGHGPGDPWIDHRNGNALDCRRSNLRVVSGSQNNMNSRRRNGSSQFKGVYFRQDTKRWAAQIKLDTRTKNLGCFVDEEAAARAYDTAARFHFGEFAALNFAEADEQSALRKGRRL